TPAAALMAACTSWVAPSMSRLRSNCSEIWLTPNELVDCIDDSEGICPRWRSNGAVIRDALTSALAAGNLLVTCTVGKSTCGSADTGSAQYPSAPPINSAIPSSEVA